MTEAEWVQHLNRCARSHCADLSAAQFAELAALVSSLALARDEANMESVRNTHARIVAEQERDEARSMGAALTNRHAEVVAEREKLKTDLLGCREFSAAETEHANKWAARANAAEAEVERLQAENADLVGAANR